MVSLGSSFQRTVAQPRQILPNRAQLRAALDDPNLQLTAEAELAQLPPALPLTLSEHSLAANWLRRQQRPRMMRWWAAACIALLLGSGLTVMLLIGQPQVPPALLCKFSIPQNKFLSPPASPAVQQEALVEGSPGGKFEFPIEATPTPKPPIAALVFVMQGDGPVRAIDLLQPQPRPQPSMGFFVEAPVDVLLQRKALHPGDNQLYVVVGRPNALPQTGRELEQELNQGPLPIAPEQRVVQIIHVTARISRGEP